MTANLTASTILSLIDAHLSACAARLGEGKGADIAAQRKPSSVFCIEEKHAQFIAAQGVTRAQLELIFPASGDRNPKVTKRFAQFVYGVQAGQFPEIDLTTARTLLALREAGGNLNRDAIAYLLRGNAGGKPTQANTKGVTLGKLDKLTGRIGRGTVETQLSRSFGAHGFCVALGMCESAGKTNFSLTLQPEAPMSRAFFALLDTATDSQLATLGNKGKGE